MGRGWGSLEVRARNTEPKDNSGEVSGGNDGCVIGHWRNSDPFKKWRRTTMFMS